MQSQLPTCLLCRWVALAISVYLLAVHLILYNVRRIVHVEAAYFASLNGSLMWWTYLRNLGEVVLGRVSLWGACTPDCLALHQSEYVPRCCASLRSLCAARDLPALPAGHGQVFECPVVQAQKDNRRSFCAMQVMPKYNAFKISKVPGGEKQDQSKAGIQTRALEVS